MSTQTKSSKNVLFDSKGLTSKLDSSGGGHDLSAGARQREVTVPPAVPAAAPVQQPDTTGTRSDNVTWGG